MSTTEKKEKKEQKESSISTTQVLKYFRKKTMEKKGLFFTGILLIVGTTVFSLIIPIIFSQIADLIKQFGEQGDEGKNGIMKDFLSLIVTMGICNLIRLGFSFASARISDLLASKALSTMYRESIAYIYQNSYRFFTENPSGGILSKIEKFADAYPSFLYVLFDQLISLIILLPGIIIVMVRENMWLGLIFVAYTMIWIGVQLLLNKKQDTLSAKESEERSKKTAYLADTLSNSFNMLSFASQKKEEKKLLDIVESRRKDRFNKNFFFTKARISRSSINIFFKLGIFALGVKFWEIGWIEIATILLVRNYTENLESRLFYLAGMFREISRIFGDSKEMIEIFNTPYEIVDKTQKKLTIPHGAISFEKVGFHYTDKKEIFKNLTFDIKPGEKIAFVGKSGSGKSTLTKLLFRFYDLQRGKILIDGQDISQVTQESLRSQISLVPQEPILFHRSLRENILYGNPQATEEEMIAACKIAKCHDFITNLEQGYDTLVGERGIKLSGGERQRVAIARAVLQNNSILILDEATSALDSESEKRIQEAMDEVMKNKTVIVIAHRLSTIAKMDKIFVMNEGEIIEKGSHKELLAKEGGTYKKLWELQSGGFLQFEEDEKRSSKE